MEVAKVRVAQAAAGRGVMVRGKGNSAGRADEPLLDLVARAADTALLRTTASVIQQDHVGRGRRALAICAAAAGSGVSFVTASLGIALARAGTKTLIVDANFHRPAMHNLFVSETAVGIGLRQVLRGEVDMAAVVAPSGVAEDLSVAYAGDDDSGATDLFDTEVFERAVEYCMRSYDLTIIDAPPANRCAETRRIAAVAGYAAIVARRDVTYAADLSAIVADLQLNRVEVIGTILNEG